MRSRTRYWTGLLVALAAATARGGEIGVTTHVLGQPPSTQFYQVVPGQAFDIVVGELTGEMFVHVFDVTANDPIDSLGMLTIVGTNDSGHILRVAVAAQSWGDPDRPFEDPVTPTDPTLSGLGGFRVRTTTGSESPSLRDRTVVNVHVEGDISGPVTAGRLFRVQASRNQSNTVGGVISGDLHATGHDGIWRTLSYPPLGESAIGQVWAEWQITGSITADGASAFAHENSNTWGSLERVVVNRPAGAGPVPAIAGNIFCLKGRIKDIVCPGQIGTQSSPVTISAGVQLGRITIRQEGTAGDNGVLAESVYANIEASAQGVSEQHRPFEGDIAGESLVLIETNGDFVGDISAYSIHRDNPAYTREQGDSGLRRAGIFVGGDFHGDITIEQDCLYRDMIARSFRGKISVGNQFKGAIVAVGSASSTDPLDGSIEEIDIGNTLTPDPLAPPLRPGFSAISHGFMAPPFEGSDREDWYTRPGTNSSTVDSVIRAEKSIGNLRIKTISNRIYGLLTDPPKDAKARIEAPVIGSLTIDNFDSGAVWSGKLAAAAGQDPMADDYASIGTLSIGCMGPTADLWVKDCQLVDVKGDMFGEIHLPELAASQTIRVAGALGDASGALNKPLCDGTEGQTYGFVPYQAAIEDSPRGYWDDVEGVNVQRDPFTNAPIPGIADYSRIVLSDPSSLNGQIIIDANNTTGTHRADRWTGDIVIGSGTPLNPGVPVVLSTSPIRAQYPTATGPQPESAVAPLYSIPSSVLAGTASGTRGGAVGLVPFARYEADCNPENYRYFEETNHSNAPFLNEDNFVAGAVAAEVAYYGPVFSAGKGLELNRVNRFNPTLLGPVGDTLYTTDAANGNRAKPRVVAVTGNNEVLLGGRFALLPRGTASPTDDLLCDLGPGIAPPLTFEPADSATRFARYDFLLAEPCSQSQCSQCFADMGFPLNQFCFIADHNNDDGIDGDDVIAFFTDWEASNQNADVNFDNGVDGDDISVFFCWWDAGGCNAN